MNLEIKDKSVLVTASSKGIGKAVAKIFLEEDCRVAICSSNEKNVTNTLKELFAYGPKIIGGICDLNSTSSIQNFYNFVKDRFDTVDILVNNCGGPIPGTFENLTEDNWRHAFNQVLYSAVTLSKLVLPDMLKNNWGRIVNITSLSVKQPVENLMLSNTFRTGLIGFAKTLSAEVGYKNITVNNVAPGYTMTDRLKELSKIIAEKKKVSSDEVLQQMANSVPLKKIGAADDIANLIVFLSSEKARYITGTTIQVDGGAVKSTF